MNSIEIFKNFYSFDIILKFEIFKKEVKKNYPGILMLRKL